MLLELFINFPQLRLPVSITIFTKMCF